uniref:Hyaluronidase n=1 Tax=Haemonchus contortus TaxID=6289 RepID=A0A7I4Z831_HAECO
MKALVLSVQSLLSFLIVSTAAQGFYKVFWNLPSRPCEKKKINIPLNKFKIVHNEGFNFTGEKIVIFYEKKFGLCPYYENNDPKRPVNGGIPQNASLADHLAAVSKQIKRVIPNKNFDGIAVLDLEEWRPLFEMNWGPKKVYKKQSIAFVKARFPDLSRKEVDKQAEKEFNKAAREFFTQTLKLAIKLRPKGRWGYYDYPFCNGNAGELPDDFSCKEEAKRYNNKLAFIYNASTALFPSIYLNGKKTSDQSFRYVQALLKETKRIANEQKRRPNFFAYTKFEYDPRTDYTWFYNKEDLCSTVKQPADLGARGLVLWSTSTDMKDRCYGIANYIDTQFGPVLLNLRRKLNVCRQMACSGRGVCVLRHPARTCSFDFNFFDYDCQCDRGYEGMDCSNETTVSVIP